MTTGHEPGKTCVITHDPRGKSIGLTGVVGAVLGPAHSIPEVIIGAAMGYYPEEILNTTLQELTLDVYNENGAWPVEWMRPIDEDIDEDDQEVIDALKNPNRVPADEVS
jgi:hypothetical protein